MSVRWFIDTADVNAWREWMPAGLFFGVTTNPLLLERAGVACTEPELRRLANAAFDLGVQELHVQTWGSEVLEMVRRGEAISALDPRVVVKVPITRKGTEAAARLASAGISVTMTGLYAPHQAATAIVVGAAYAAPYLGRMNEAGRDGHEAIATMLRMIHAAGSSMRLLVASLRNVSDIAVLMEGGADTFTLAPSLLPQLFDDPCTLAATADFERAARAQP